MEGVHVQVEVRDNVISSICYLKCSKQNGSWTGDDAFNACTHIVSSSGACTCTCT